MKLLVAPDSSMYVTPDGNYWCPTIYEYSFFERYLSVFDELVVASRVKKASYQEVKGFLLCSGPNIEVACLPDMHGMRDYLIKIIPFIVASIKASQNVDCALFRLPSIPASMVLHFYKKRDKKYALEVVADPEDAYVSNIFAKLLFSKILKRECLRANGVSYVTKYYLQDKYPSHARLYGSDSNHFESYYSTIRLAKEYYSQPRSFYGKESFTIIHTSNNMNNELKGHKELILAFKEVVDKGFDVQLRLIGDGSLRPKLEEMVDSIGIRDRVTFVGRLSGSDYVREELLSADLFVFPTKAEGLPRSLIEAMAVGLPCISSPVAGIPELLDEDDMVDPDDIHGLSSRIIVFLNNPSLLEKKSMRNISCAMQYSEDLLKDRRDRFYNKLKDTVID